MEKPSLILFYNTMWDQPLTYSKADIPEPYMLTTDRRFMQEATAVVFHLPALPPRLFLHGHLGKRKGQIWVAWSMECEAHYPHLGNPSFMSCFDLTMTYHLDADIVLSYVPHGFRELMRRPVHDKDAGNIVNAFISSRFNKSGRMEYLKELMKCIDLHSYGKKFRTRSIKKDGGRQTKMDIISRYKFTLAFENAIARDYVTEKFYDPLMAGSVPVYLGAPNINDFAPAEGCFINASAWDSPKSLAQYLMAVSQDDILYRSFFEWKTKPLKQTLVRLLELQKEHAFVRLCKKIRSGLKALRY
ncbi:MAG: glycosyltransferase family 10 domain-containing protein [bacterium]